MTEQKMFPEVSSINEKSEISLDQYSFEPIKGFPMLNWKGKRPFTTTQFYPAQLKEVYGEPGNGWRNKLYWGDNLQVMSHLLKEYRGKIQLIYIDPPFDSKADYKMKIELYGKKMENNRTAFEEKQYSDIWTNDEYLQFMYERLILMRELLSDVGAIYVHCDWRMNSNLRLILDEIFGKNNFVNEIIWSYRSGGASKKESLPRKHDSILLYKKEKFEINAKYERQYLEKPFMESKTDENGRFYVDTLLRDIFEGVIVSHEGDGLLKEYNIRPVLNLSSERTNYPTQKPEDLFRLLIELATNRDDLVADFFCGSGTAFIASMKSGRRFIGSDINLGAIQTAKKRLISKIKEIQINPTQTQLENNSSSPYYTNFEVYNVNNYDIFRNPVEAKDLLLDALEVQKLESGQLFDGEKDGRMVKIMPVNRIATRADLSELISGFDYKSFTRRQEENPNKPVLKLTLVCMGHESDLAAHLKQQTHPFLIDVEIIDILRDKKELQFKRDAEAKITAQDGVLRIDAFYPMNLLQKMSAEKESIEDWRVLVDSILIDWNYDGETLRPTVMDIPKKSELVKGVYPIPDNAEIIRIKITDVLSESLEKEIEVKNG